MQGEGLKNFRTGGGLPIWGEVFLLGDQYLITYNVTFIYVMTLLIVQNFKKFFTADTELWQCAIFGPNLDHLPEFFLWKIIIILIYLLVFFIVQNLKKLLPADPELWGCATFGPKMTHFPKWEFFSENLLMSLVSFIHAYLHAKN